MSDRVAVMNHGVVEQIGGGDEIYRRPLSRFVADFIGETNLFTGQVLAHNGDGNLLVQAGSLSLVAPSVSQAVPGATVHVSVRPETIRVRPDGTRGSGNRLPGQLVEKIFAGSSTRLAVRVDGGQTVVAQTQDAALLRQLEGGSPVTISWEPEDSAVMIA